MSLPCEDTATHSQPRTKTILMYEAFYGLNAKPFSLLPDPAYLFLSRQHKVAMSLLEYAVTNDVALSVVTGEVGSGKTTLVRQLLRRLDPTFSVGLISNTHADFPNLMKHVALAFGLPFKNLDEVELHQQFTDFLIDEYAKARRVVLIVDEAQNLDANTLEEIRLLTNINADNDTLLQLILVGQPEFHDLLRKHELRQIAQRIGIVTKLEPLNEKETAMYVQHRLAVAGGDPKLFNRNALRLIYWNSGGIPRVINNLCELALVYGYAGQRKRIDALMIADIARNRVDTGLYGNRVFDTATLKVQDAVRRAERKAAQAQKAKAKQAAVQKILKEEVQHLRADKASDPGSVLGLVSDGSDTDKVSVKKIGSGSSS